MARQKEVFGVTVDGDISGLKSKMNEATRLFNSTERSIKDIDKALKLDPSNLDLLTKKQELCNKAINDGENALKKLKQAQDDITNDKNFQSGNTDLTERYAELQLKITQVTSELENLKKELASMPTAETQQFINQFNELGDNLDAISQKTQAMSRVFQTLLTTSFNYAADYEEQIASIKKIVTDLSDNTIQKLKDIAVDTGTTFEEVSEYATFTGALGVAEDEIADFTQVMIDLNTATSGAFSGETGAKGVVVFLNNLGLGVEQASNFGSAISEIGDKMADVGDETLQMAIALAGLGTVSDVDQYDLIGLAGVMKNLGLRTSTSSNAITKSFMSIESAIATGDDKLQTFAKTANMTADEFSKAWAGNATDTFLKFVDGIKSSVSDDINTSIANGTELVNEYAEALGYSREKFIQMWGEDQQGTLDKYIEKMEDMDDSSENASVILKELDLSGVRVAETLLKLSGQGDNVREAIQLANDAWNENTALTDKANVMYETTEKKLEGVKESLKQAASSIMTEALPAVKDVLDVINNLTKGFSDLSPTAKQLILVFATMGATVSPVTKILSKTTKGLAKFIGTISGAVPVSASFVATIAELAIALGTMAYLDYVNSDIVQLKNSIKETSEAFEELSETSDQNYARQSAMLDVSEEYADKIDKLNSKLNDTNLTEEESKNIKSQITDYIEILNEALGNEAFYFDETTGKISYQGEVIDTVKGKLENLSVELHKEAWLDTHKEEFEESYEKIETARQKLDDAASVYQQKLDEIPQKYIDLYEKYGGDLGKISEAVQAGEITENDIENISKYARLLKDGKDTISEIEANIEEAQKAQDDYLAIVNSNEENFYDVLDSIQEQVTYVDDTLTTSKEKLDDLLEKKDTYLKLTEDTGDVDEEYLQTLNDEIDSLQKQVDKEQEIYDKIVDENTERKSGMDIFDLWAATATHKSLVIDVTYNYTNSGPNGGISIPTPLSGGTQSGGFGNIIDNVNRTMYNHHTSPMRSGGFASGGVTLNASFNITNGNQINQKVVRGWASTMVDIINEELGGKL